MLALNKKASKRGSFFNLFFKEGNTIEATYSLLTIHYSLYSPLSVKPTLMAFIFGPTPSLNKGVKEYEPKRVKWP